MAEKLRRKFILISLSAVFVVILAIGLFSNVSNFIQITRNADVLLDVLISNNGYFPKPDTYDENNRRPPKISPEAPFTTRFFTVKIDKEDNLLEIDTGKISSTSTDQALTYANEVLKSQKSSGFIDNYKYQMSPKEYGSLLVFVDMERDLEIFYSFLLSSIIIGLIAITSVFIIVMILSKKAISPIVEGYEKQKQFITDAGHELKTPLTIINTNTEVLEMNHGESQWTKSIHNQVVRLSNLVESLVSLSRMDEESNQIIKKEFSISEITQNIIDEFQLLSNTYHKTLISKIDEKIFYWGDEQLIGQLISILLDNALKYSVNDSYIEIKMKKQGKRVVLTIMNEAENLTIGNYDILFERFYRADTSRNTKLGGYGIGLSVAKAIVQKHKGKISAESLDGKSLIISVKV
ncbi:MAG: HAMP domain-containing histidine kinase [Clostridium sp.]|nr:HAMP domain-containing histidine kinase [Clostridium sp.]